VSTETNRTALAAALGASVDGILVRLAEEAARSSTLGSEPESEVVDSYLDWMRAFVPAALDAAAADDQHRAELLKRWATTTPPTHLRAVPPVARRGLFTLGIRLAREEVAAYARATGKSESALVNEMDRFTEAMAATLAARSIGVT
jgi:hypothetical protein